MPLSSTATIDWRGFTALGDPKLAEMHAAAQRLADEIASEHPGRWLTLTGAPGIGKTHLAKCIHGWYERKGCLYTEPTRGARVARPHRFVKWRNVATSLREGDWAYLQDLEGLHFLAIDDIGAEYQAASGAVQSALEGLLDNRIGKWTFLTSNLTQQEIAEKLGARVASRITRDGNLSVGGKSVADFSTRGRAKPRAVPLGVDEPEGFAEWLQRAYPNAARPWSQIKAYIRPELLREFSQAK